MKKILPIILAAILSFGAGFFIGKPTSDQVEKIEGYSTLENELEERNNSIENLEKENKELSEKVEEAAPYFDLKEEERLAVEAEAKAKEEARIAEEKRKEEERIAAEKAAEEEAARKAEEERLAALEARKVTLTPGNYVAGSDFEPGKYNIICIGGSGNVISSDFSINLIMAPTTDGFYINEYKNAKLNKNVNLQVEGCTIELVPVE